MTCHIRFIKYHITLNPQHQSAYSNFNAQANDGDGINVGPDAKYGMYVMHETSYVDLQMSHVLYSSPPKLRVIVIDPNTLPKISSVVFVSCSITSDAETPI